MFNIVQHCSTIYFCSSITAATWTKLHQHVDIHIPWHPLGGSLTNNHRLWTLATRTILNNHKTVAMVHTLHPNTSRAPSDSEDRMAPVQSKHPASSENNTPQTPQSTITGNPVETGAVDAMEKILSILPTGFVENTAEVYREVASFDTVPPEKLREYWRGMFSVHRCHCWNIFLLTNYLQSIQSHTRNFTTQQQTAWKTSGGMSGAASAET